MPDKRKNWHRTDFSAPETFTLEIEGAGTLNITQGTLRFAKNSIPEAIVVPQVGRKTSDGVTYAEIHKIARNIKRGAKAKLYARPTLEWDTNGKEWPGDKRVIFEGRYNGMVLKRMEGRYTAGLSIGHWAQDLTAGSMLSKDIHSSSGVDMRDPAAFGTIPGSGIKLPSSYISYLTGSTAIEAAAVDDVVGAIKTALCALANTENLVLDNSVTGLVDNTANEIALAALSRLEGPAEDCDFPYEYGVPATLKHLDLVELPYSIAKAILAQPLAQLGSITYWDALVRWYCPTFQLAVVPLVDRLLLVPDCPVVDKFSSRYFTPNDITSATSSLVNVQQLRGVGVFARYPSETGIVTGDDLPITAATARLSGYFEATAPELKAGAVLYLPGPDWMNDLSWGGPYVEFTAPTDGLMGTSTTVSADAPLPERATPTKILADGHPMMNAYAKSLFAQQCLAHSTIQLTSKFRFDVCPGMMLEVRPIPETAGDVEADKLATGYWGQVTEVSLNFSVQPANAQTEITLGFVRTEADRAISDLSLSEHPLYGSNIFTGSPLVVDPDDAWGFPNE